jgi:GTPase
VLAKHKITVQLTLGHEAGADIALFYQYGEVLERVDSETECHLKVRLDPAAIGQLTKMGKLDED